MISTIRLVTANRKKKTDNKLDSAHIFKQYHDRLLSFILEAESVYIMRQRERERERLTNI